MRCLLPILLALTFALPAPAGDAPPRRRWIRTGFTLQLASWDGSPFEATEQVIRRAAATWNAVGIGPLIQVSPEPAPRAEVAYDGIHTVFFVTADWPSAPDELALTYTHLDPSTREILEVDIAINAQHHRFSLGGYEAGAFDLQNLLTHELGHALGLIHIEEAREATMHPAIQPGETDKRDLAPIDEQALFSLYEDGFPATGPRYGCHAAPIPEPTFLLLGLLALLSLRRRLPKERGRCPSTLSPKAGAPKEMP